MDGNGAPKPPNPNEIEALVTAAYHLWAAKAYMLASFVMLIYDMILTFDQEVERFWKPKWNGVTILWALNRYLNPLEFIINLVAFHHPGMSEKKICKKFYKFPGAGTVTSLAIVELILILRTYALYGRNKWILAITVPLYCLQISYMSYAVSQGAMQHLPPGLVGCILGSRRGRSSLFNIAPLVFETVIFILTISRSIYLSRHNVRGRLVRTIVRDGAIYFFCIVIANLISVFFNAFAPPTLRPINATFSHLITIVLVSRLMLNLSKVGQARATQHRTTLPHTTSRVPKPEETWRLTTDDSAYTPTFMESVLDQLGQPLDASLSGEDSTDRGTTAASISDDSYTYASSRSRHTYPPPQPAVGAAYVSVQPGGRRPP